MRWQEATPGIERASCVLRPIRDHEHCKYVRVIACGGTVAFIGINHQRFDSALVHATYSDTVGDARIISARRVEEAVELATFLEICTEERLTVTHFAAEGCGWMVTDTYRVPPRSGSAKTLRGAYLNCHGGA